MAWYRKDLQVLIFSKLWFVALVVMTGTYSGLVTSNMSNDQHGWVAKCYKDQAFAKPWWYYFDDEVTQCNVRCPFDCYCSLDNFTEVLINCTNGNISVVHISYPSKVTLLSWANNKIFSITRGAFSGLPDTLEILHLNDNNLKHLQNGVFEGLLHPTSLLALDLRHNMLEKIQPGVFKPLRRLMILDMEGNLLKEIQTGTFTGLEGLAILNISNNMLKGVQPGVFDDLHRLWQVSLSCNRLINIQSGVFAEGITNLRALQLSHNRLTLRRSSMFQNLTKLDALELRNLRLQVLPKGIFQCLKLLRYLDLSDNKLQELSYLSFQSNVLLQTLNLTQNPLQWLNKNAFNSLNTTALVLVDNYASCCFVTEAICHSRTPKSAFITCGRLLDYGVLRVGIWVVSVLAISANVLCVLGRSKQRQKSNKVQFWMITNLSISDFLMGMYLIILLSVDLYYKDYFPSHSEAWRNSALCKIAGSLSVLSSEASVFFITMISIDRAVAINYPFRTRRLGTKYTCLVVSFLWLVTLGISIVSFVLSEMDSDIYPVPEICVGLPISRHQFYTKNETLVRLTKTFSNTVPVQVYKADGSQVAMYFSIAIFTVLNLSCFIVVGLCYTTIFISARQSSRNTGRSANLKQDIRMAKKMFLLVFTDFCCWVPIGVLSILVQAGAVEVNPVAYAWIATFILPINASINPFLYSFGAVIGNKVSCPCKNGKNIKSDGIIEMRQITRN